MKVDGVEVKKGKTWTRVSDFAEMAAVLGVPLATALVPDDDSANGVYVVTEGSWERDEASGA